MWAPWSPLWRGIVCGEWPGFRWSLASEEGEWDKCEEKGQRNKITIFSLKGIPHSFTLQQTLLCNPSCQCPCRRVGLAKKSDTLTVRYTQMSLSLMLALLKAQKLWKICYYCLLIWTSKYCNQFNMHCLSEYYYYTWHAISQLSSPYLNIKSKHKLLKNNNEKQGKNKRQLTVLWGIMLRTIVLFLECQLVACIYLL